MDVSYESIQANFIKEMRQVIPSVLAWWSERSDRSHLDLTWDSPRNDFERRWPLGPVSHPRILHLVRLHFLQTYRLNVENESRRKPNERPIREDDWGEDDGELDVAFRLPVDLLVHDIEEVAPDVHEIVSNLVFVPVGQSPEEEFC